MHGPMQAYEVPLSLQGLLQFDSATKKHYQVQERYVGKVYKEKEFCGNDDESTS